MKYQDLVYFGYSHGEEAHQSKEYEKEFKEDLILKFPHVEFKDAYDDIKGYRQEVYLKEEDNDEYVSWIIANGWHEFSLTTSLMFMDPSSQEKAKTYIEKAKLQYPDKFKS